MQIFVEQHGDEEPYAIKTWCMGNEMDGPWQLGHKTAEEYGRLANETAKAMKDMDSSIECVLCGSSSMELPTFPEWERVILEEAYDNMDYISLHKYFRNVDDDVADFLAKSDDLKQFIDTVTHICDYIKAQKNSDKTIYLSLDEWNVWYHSRPNDEIIKKTHPWEIAQPYLEDDYNFEDALMVGECLINIIQHCDRIKIACLAQLINVIAPIRTEKEGVAWKQTIFYPFCQASKYGRGIALCTDLVCDVHDTTKHKNVSDIEAVSVWNEKKNELTVFAVNRNPSGSVTFSAEVKGFSELSLLEYSVMKGYDLKQTNSEKQQAVVPVEEDNYVLEKSVFTTSFSPLSWNVIRFLEKRK